MRRIDFSRAFKGNPRQGFVEKAHAFGKAHDDLHSDRCVFLYEEAVLVALDTDERHIGDGLGGFYVAMSRHRRNDAKKITRGVDVAAFFLDNFDFLGDADLARFDNVETVRVLLSFYNYI